MDVLFLDTDIEANTPEVRRLTHHLYGGDAAYRLAQELILGVGGLRMLRTLGYSSLCCFHMNEGHAAFLGLERLVEEQHKSQKPSDVRALLHKIRNETVFTTHTPVPAGHDRFDASLVEQTLPETLRSLLNSLGFGPTLNMTQLALEVSGFVNGVAIRHGEISRDMFPNYPIHSITNGVHHTHWTSPPFARLFDRYLHNWRRDPYSLRYAASIPLEDIWQAHQENKASLMACARQVAHSDLDCHVFTIGYARRFTAYKRPGLLFSDFERLQQIAAKHTRLQILFAGKAHPRDTAGKTEIQNLIALTRQRSDSIRVVYLPNYDMALAKVLVAGVDLWLNTPLPPLEASGTSGMKAALNAVPHLSTLDGWWLEGHIEGVTGWSIDPKVDRHSPPAEDLDRIHAQSLYEKLEQVILPCFDSNRPHYQEIMRNAIAINASFFNTQRMMSQYVIQAYRQLTS